MSAMIGPDDQRLPVLGITAGAPFVRVAVYFWRLPRPASARGESESFSSLRGSSSESARPDTARNILACLSAPNKAFGRRGRYAIGFGPTAEAYQGIGSTAFLRGVMHLDRKRVV